MPFHVELNLHENFRKLKIEEFHKYCSEFFVAELKNTKILDTDHVVTVIKNNKIIKQLSFDPLKREIHPSLTIFCYPQPIFLKGKTLLLATPGAQNNYFHFTLDLLQKIGFAKECGYSIDEFDNILINKILYDFQRDLLKIFGVPENKIVETMPNSFFHCEKVVIPSHSPHNYFGFSYINSTILNELISFKKTHSHRIFISREKANGRRIVNEGDLMNLLGPLGFETIYLENLTVIEQVQLFKNAEVIITPHGAGTANIIYSNPGTVLIEIHDIGAPLNVDFYPYISYKELKYGYLFAQTVVNPATNHFNFQDILVDIEKLKKLIKKMNLNL
jgi:capsular polysaccharide biosynthesis protein